VDDYIKNLKQLSTAHAAIQTQHDLNDLQTETLNNLNKEIQSSSNDQHLNNITNDLYDYKVHFRNFIINLFTEITLIVAVVFFILGCHYIVPDMFTEKMLKYTNVCILAFFILHTILSIRILLRRRKADWSHYYF
jgi:hypothetical protein